MGSYRRLSLSLLVLAVMFVFVVRCNEDPIRSPSGSVSVSVTDGASGPPVANVEIRIAPTGATAITDAQGVAHFELPPGDYFVDAEVCCVGPGNIHHHVAVTVTAGQTESVELIACSECV